jgi:molybdate transport system permease protein
MFAQGDMAAISVSFGVATRALIFSLPPAILFAYALSRPRLRGRLVLDGLVHLPLVLPPVLTGFLLLVLFGRQGPIGHWLYRLAGIQLAFTEQGAALATGVMIFPVLVRNIRLAFEATDGKLFGAAAVLRASPLDRFFTIALPLAGPGILAGAVTAFAAAMGEFGAVITFAANIPGQTQTLPLAIYAALQSPGGEPQAWRLAGLSFLVALCGLAGAALLNRWARARLKG